MAVVSKRLVVVICLMVLQACATSKTTTHYGFFEAENSSGELRQFRVVWETIEVQGFNDKRRYTSPITLETQCSERRVKLYDANFPAQRSCMDKGELGIAFCGKPSRDVDYRGLAIEPGTVCAYVTDLKNAGAINVLGEQIKITLRCQPREPKVREGRAIVNQDYLKPSKIAYEVATKTIDGSDRDGHVPQLWNHSSVCDPNQGR